jgi:hypothetical protein
MSLSAIPRMPGSGTALPSAQQDAALRMQITATFVRPEAEILDRLRLAFFGELQVPLEEEPEQKSEQMRLMRVRQLSMTAIRRRTWAPFPKN